MKTMTILGSTGSIGTQALEVAPAKYFWKLKISGTFFFARRNATERAHYCPFGQY